MWWAASGVPHAATAAAGRAASWVFVVLLTSLPFAVGTCVHPFHLHFNFAIGAVASIYKRSGIWWQHTLYEPVRQAGLGSLAAG